MGEEPSPLVEDFNSIFLPHESRGKRKE